MSRLLRATAAALLIACWTATAGAATVSPAPSQMSVDVRAERAWFGGDVPLSLDVEIRSRGGSGDVSVTTALYERSRSRSDLDRVFSGKLPKTPVAAFTTPAGQLGASGVQRMRIERTAESLTGFQKAYDGVYPLAVSVRQAGGTVVASAITAIAYFGSAPRSRLQILPVLLIAPSPLLQADGRPYKTAGARIDALRTGLQQAASAPVWPAATGVLADELDLLRTSPLRDKAEALSEALRSVAPGRAPLALPYTYGRADHLYELGGRDELVRELSDGAAAARRIFDSEPSPLVYLPGLSYSSRVLSVLAELKTPGVVVAGSALSTPSSALTPAEPVDLGPVTALPADTGLQTRLSAARTGAGLSRALADTAMIYFESPARSRMLVVTSPNLGATAPFLEYVEMLADAPWVKPVTPSEALSSAARLVRGGGAENAKLSPVYKKSVAEARRAVVEMRSIMVHDNPAQRALELSMRTAMGTVWWQNDPKLGTSRARAVSAAVKRVRGLISAGASPVTFTSRRGEVPITIANRTSFPVRVRVEVVSPKLQFPEGAVRVFESLDPPGRTVTFKAITRATGTFPLQVRLTSADGTIVVDEKRVVVRSTAYNLLALALTAFAALFLIVWYVRRLIARRRPSATAA